MKNRMALLAALTVAGVALAGGFAQLSENQIGNGSNGMTYGQPPAADGGDGLALITPLFGTAQNYAILTIATSAGGNFQNASDLSWMRAASFDINPDGGGNYIWQGWPAFDIEVDGGLSGKTISKASFSWGPIQLPNLQPGARWMWFGENLQQSVTLDAGVSVRLQLYTP
jgi:hypothetical protein